MRRALLLALLAALAVPAGARGDDPPEIRTVVSDGHAGLALFGFDRPRAAILRRDGSLRRISFPAERGPADEVAVAAADRHPLPGFAVAWRRANRAGEGPTTLHSALLSRSGRRRGTYLHTRVRAGAVDPSVAITGDGRWVGWRGDDGYTVQRIGDDGVAGPQVVVAPVVERALLAGDADGATWAVYSRLDPVSPLRQEVLARRVERSGALGPEVLVREHPERSELGASLLDAAGGNRLRVLTMHRFERRRSEGARAAGLCCREEVLELASVTRAGEVNRREVARNSSDGGGVRGRLEAVRGAPLAGGVAVGYRAVGPDGRVRALVRGFAEDLAPGAELSFGILGGPGAFAVGLDGRARTVFHERRDMRVAAVALDGSEPPRRRRVTSTPRAREASSAIAYGRGGLLFAAWSEGNRVAGHECPREVAYARVLLRRGATPVRLLGRCR